MHKVLLSSEQENWQTPTDIIKLIRKIGPINLDPCADDDPDNWFAKHNLVKKDDGLTFNWENFGYNGLVYVNSPYGREIKKWVNKIISEPNLEIIQLCPARPGSVWWKSCWINANAFCFFDQRIFFVGAPDPAPFPSAFFHFGGKQYKFCDVFSEHGIVGLL